MTIVGRLEVALFGFALAAWWESAPNILFAALAVLFVLQIMKVV